ncbi:MAG: hypothetical protein ABSB15_12580 [Bryobacteraceae bacterium]|jgi:hypothetical protein
MSGSSIIVLSLVAIFFSDLLPDGKQVETVTHELRKAPTYTAGQIRPDLDSLYGDCQGVHRQILNAPSEARSLWLLVQSDARLLYAEARDKAHQFTRRVAAHGESR